MRWLNGAYSIESTRYIIVIVKLQLDVVHYTVIYLQPFEASIDDDIDQLMVNRC